MQTEQPQFYRDKLSFLSRSFLIELSTTALECIDQLEAEATVQPLGKPKKSRLEISALDEDSYQFSFEGIGVLGSLQFRGVIEQSVENNTVIKGFVRLSDTALLKNAGMILITLLFIKLPYISIAFLVLTVSSIYFDVRLLKNAATVLEEFFKPD